MYSQVTADIIRRIKEIEAERDTYKDSCEAKADRIDRLGEQVESLRAEIEALRTDAQRYRWLRGGPDVPPESTRWARWEVRNWRGRWWHTMFSEALDAAIDAARSGGGK